MTGAIARSLNDEGVGVEGLVGDQSAEIDGFDQRFGASEIVILDCADLDRIAESVDQRVDLDRQSAAGSADGLRRVFLSAGAMPVSAHDGGVNHHVFVVAIAARQNVIDRDPIGRRAMRIVASVGPSSGRPLTSQTFADSEIPRASERQVVPHPILIRSRVNCTKALVWRPPKRIRRILFRRRRARQGGHHAEGASRPPC